MSNCGCADVGKHLFMMRCLHPTPRTPFSLSWKQLRSRTGLKPTVAVTMRHIRGSFVCAMNQTVGGLLLPQRESSEEKVRSKGRVFFLDVNPLCYDGNTPSLHSFGHWLSLFFNQVSLSDPVIAVSTLYPSVFLPFCHWVETWDCRILLVFNSRRKLHSISTTELMSTVNIFWNFGNGRSNNVVLFAEIWVSSWELVVLEWFIKAKKEEEIQWSVVHINFVGENYDLVHRLWVKLACPRCIHALLITSNFLND